MDGTFKLCTQIFYQIYTIHALINNLVFPCLFALLPNKIENIYTRLLTEEYKTLQNVGNDPTDILLDFDVISAVRIQMPQVQVNIKISPTIL